jgi:hypothetical protein
VLVSTFERLFNHLRIGGALTIFRSREPQRGVGVDRIPLDPEPSDQNAMTISTIFTLHGRLDLPNIELMGQRFPNAPVVSIRSKEPQSAPSELINST